jgi:hypothetical protein
MGEEKIMLDTHEETCPGADCGDTFGRSLELSFYLFELKRRCHEMNKNFPKMYCEHWSKLCASKQKYLLH